MKIVMDTHIHSNASDGLWSPEEIVRQAKNRGLEVIALTDHDTVNGINLALEEATKQRIKLITGIEIDARRTYGNVAIKGIEILGLNLNIEAIRPFAERRTKSRIQLFEDYITAFNEYILLPDYTQINERFNLINKEGNFDCRLQNVRSISLEEILSWKWKNPDKNKNKIDEINKIELKYKMPFLSRVEFINYIYSSFGNRNTCKKIFSSKDLGNILKEKYHFLWNNEKRKKPNSRKPTFYSAIKEIKKADGIAILAHPGITEAYGTSGMLKEWEYPKIHWFKPKLGFTPFQLVSDLKEFKIDGEIYHLDGLELYNYLGNGKVKDIEEQKLINDYFNTMATELKLMVTYGSDCHGPRFGKEPLMGTFGSEKIIEFK